MQYILKHFNDTENRNEDGLSHLQDKLFISILNFSLPIGILVYIPSLIVSIMTQQIVIAFFDTLALGGLLLIFLVKSQKLKVKKIAFSAIFYILSVILFLFLGTKGPSIIILLCLSVLITLYQGKKSGLISVGFNAAIFSLVLAILPFDPNHFAFFNEYTLLSWIGVVLNLIAFNTITILSVSFLVDQLNSSLVKERNLHNQLQLEREELIAAKEKAEESDRLKTAFLANVSHEIRTPMNGILGFAEILKEPDLTSEQQQEYLGIIEKSGARMLNIINDIVDLSKIESGQMLVSLSETNVNEQLNFVYRFFEPEAEQKGLKLLMQNSLSLSEAIIRTDREKLYAILTNLVKNAIKYTPLGSIEFGCHVVETRLALSLLQFYVKVTGIGIPKDRQEAIFERFIQSDISKKDAYQGAGLGLAISKAYVKKLGGKLWVESEEGKGSRFYFTIPC